MARKTQKSSRKKSPGSNRLYTFEVFLQSGPMTEEFAEKNKVVSRTIQIRGDQTLEDLHYAIFDAFDREEEHLYEFQFGQGPHDPKGKRYALPMDLDAFEPGSEPAGDVTRTPIDALRLEPGQSFGYWFDFGDDWFHQIDTIAVANEVRMGKYPKVTERVGESPPQYADWDDEEEGDDEAEWDEEDEA